ncbi:MAG: 50S ribosomal protein L11 methyltransferase [Candidatus Thorarchaeota archaeon]
MYEHENSTPFSILHAAGLLSQRSRLSKFEQALQRTVTEDSYVVDLGTGTGILAMMAAKAGARKVTAVEIDRYSVEYARQAIKENELEEIVEVVRCHYTDFRPDEPADIVTCEMLSSAMFVEPQIPASQWAVQNILKEQGILLPRSAIVYVAPVQCSDIWERFQRSGFRFPKVPQTMERDPSRDLADLTALEEFDFQLHKSGWNVDKSLEFVALKDGVVHGLVGMFEATLIDEIKLIMEDGWKDLLLPLDNPVSVSEGDRLSFEVRYSPTVVDSLRLRCQVIESENRIKCQK